MVALEWYTKKFPALYVDCIEVLLEECLGFNCEGFTIDTFESIECNFMTETE